VSRAWREDEGTRFGSGWISGVLAVTLGVAGLGAVLCLHFPALLTTPEMRARYPMDAVRFTIHLVLVGAFGAGVISAVLRRRKRLGLTGMALAVAAVVLGGSQVPVEAPVRAAPYLGLDWFLLNVLFLALLFVPVERLFPLRPAQPIFRFGWLTDLVHFGVSHLLVQVTVLLTMAPAAVFFAWAVDPRVQGAVAAQPAVLQFVEILVVADLTEYLVHRLFHRVPALWRFHQIHHSSRALDWLAGSRLHLVDIVVTRGLTFVPLFVLGFAPGPLYAYLVFVSLHAVWIHANVRFGLGPLGALLVTPRFHHWHHAADAEAIDRNFAVHLPLIDRLFGTYHCPADRWPAAYGIAGHPVPEGYFTQALYPLRRPS
jgi:sterol desaturase/sphingolipid hydroxylase (fatty acid hydroxylase superfamily)